MNKKQKLNNDGEIRGKKKVTLVKNEMCIKCIVLKRAN